MNIKQYYSWMVAAVMAAATPFLAACSSEENLAPSRGVAVTDAHIVINVEPYGATPTAAKSRAAEAPAVTKPDTVLLANGMRAVVSMEEDAPETQAATRATMDDGHYTIFALDPATGDRITGTKKQLTGTVTGGVFQSDAGSEMILDPGTYKFVCINDAVTDHGTWLEVNTGVGTMIGVVPGVFPTASDAQIGTSTETINGDDWQVTFLMKHQNARFRLRLVAYTNQLENVVGALKTGGQHPVTLKYALDGSTPVVTEKTFPYGYTIAKLTLSNTPAESNVTYVKANNFYSNYMYVMPGGDDVEPLLVEGKAYGKSFNPAAPTQVGGLGFPSKTQRNHSYTITYRLLPEALYLFEDGSCGALAEKGTRKVIGVVAKEKTNSEDGTAAAISQVKGGTVEYAMGTSNTTLDNQFQTTVARVNGWEQYAEAYQHDDGYKNTWDVSHDGVTIKANEQTRYPAYYAAAHYGDELAAQGITLTGDMASRKWFLPSVKEWLDLCGGGITTLPGSGTGIGLGNRTFDYGAAMTAAGGTYKQGWYVFATSSEIDAGHYLGFYANYNAPMFNCPFPKKTDLTTVHPFIHF
ncbi:MAG: hypothetical protein ACFNJR_09190 [Segatella oulorum]|uniref:hypothetical protein n=1 Tax=Segatella oulorum TaxID=28136 RepID=UPI003605C0A5